MNSAPGTCGKIPLDHRRSGETDLGRKSNVMEDMHLLAQESEQTQNKIESKKSGPRHIIIKLPKMKNKEIVLGAFKEK